jgi:hypothetical protein
MPKDHRYKTVKVLIESGLIAEFNQIFLYIPKSVVSEDLGINYSRFVRLLQQVELFRLKELMLMSNFFEIDGKVMIELAHNQYLADKRAKYRK